jgi:hypothetical protein
MDILELIDLEHPNNQQEVRPFPCVWEGCTKVCHPLRQMLLDILTNSCPGLWPSIGSRQAPAYPYERTALRV